MRTKQLVLFVLAALTCSYVIVAGEAPPADVAAPAAEVVEKGTWNIPDWLTAIFTFDFFWKGLITVGGTFVTWVFGLAWLKKWREGDQKDAVAALEAGIVNTYETFVKELKENTADGKLTKEERQQARDKAIKFVLDTVKGPAKTWLLAWGKERLEAMIPKIVAKFKKEKSE